MTRGYKVPEVKKSDRIAARSSRRLREIARRRQARSILASVFGMIAALVITALLAMPHLLQEPVEAAAVPEAEPLTTVQPTATPEPEFKQHSDPFLVLVNEQVPLPTDFSLITRSYGGVEVNSLMYTQLCAMMDAAYADGHVLWVASGYRSVETQTGILERAIESRMRGGMTRNAAYEDARLTIQLPGCSEHHTGFAVDFNEVNYAFEESSEYAWLSAHAAEYGFVERYPKDKAGITGIEYEPWHYRYVGTEHAMNMKSLGMCLEEYVAYCSAAGI